MPDTPSGQITLAIIKTDIEHLTQLLEKHMEEDHELRLDHERRIRSLESRTTQIEGRQSALAVGQGVFTAVASALAGWIGSQR